MIKEINDLIDRNGESLEIQEHDSRINFCIQGDNFFYTLAATDNDRPFVVKCNKEDKKTFLSGEWLLDDELDKIMSKLKKHAC